jgi:FAD/FMN-containing dehydrogenase
MQPMTTTVRNEGASTLMPALDALARDLGGGLVRPGDAGYHELRRLWNGMIDKRPAAIARCAGAGDVARALRAARELGLAVAVRGGGHSIAGQSACDAGLMIDLSPMKAITVDPARRVATAGAGVLLGELDAATQAHGLATTLGVNSDTGIAGLTLGGGIGRLGRSHGLACDNLLSAEVVLADGRIVGASERENADLFWGLRGGGGNFGVVTRFTYRLHPLGPAVLGGMLVWDWASAPEAMRLYARFCRQAPDGVDALGVLLTGPDGRPVFAVSAFFAGSIGDGEAVLAPIRHAAPRPAQDAVAPCAYTALQASADGLFPRGRRYWWKSHFLDALEDSAIDTLVDWFARVPSPMTVIGLQLFGGAVARVPVNATAFAHRSAAWDCIPIGIWEDPAQDEANIAWVRGLWQAMRGFATGGVYVNSLGDEGEERIRAAYGPNYARLVALKAEYDPDNVFRANQNIQPRR